MESAGEVLEKLSRQDPGMCCMSAARLSNMGIALEGKVLGNSPDKASI